MCDGCYPAPAPPQPAGIQTVTSQSVVPPVTTTSSCVILPQPEKGTNILLEISVFSCIRKFYYYNDYG